MHERTQLTHSLLTLRQKHVFTASPISRFRRPQDLPRRRVPEVVRKKRSAHKRHYFVSSLVAGEGGQFQSIDETPVASVQLSRLRQLVKSTLGRLVAGDEYSYCYLWHIQEYVPGEIKFSI